MDGGEKIVAEAQALPALAGVFRANYPARACGNDGAGVGEPDGFQFSLKILYRIQLPKKIGAKHPHLSAVVAFAAHHGAVFVVGEMGAAQPLKILPHLFPTGGAGF